MPTTLEAKQAKQQLAQSICDLIREYEEAYGVTVTHVGLYHVQTISGDSETVSVNVGVEI